MTAELKAHLRADAASYGLIAKMPCAPLVEMAGWLGLACIVLDTEHGPGGDDQLLEHVRAAEATGVEPLVRVRDHSAAGILAALDAGATGVVVPHVGDARAAGEVAAAAHFPPRGRRSLALSTRAARYGLTDADAYLAQAGERTTVIVQIEDAAAVRAVDEICAVPLVDAILPGPVDLAASTQRADVGDLLAVCESAARRAGVGYCRVSGADGITAGRGLVLLNAGMIEARAWRELAARVLDAVDVAALRARDQ